MRTDSLPQKSLEFACEAAAVADFAFPDHEHGPAHSPQLRTVGLVALLVPVQLRLPILKAGTRDSSGTATRVQVPKAAVHENHFPLGRKYNVGASRQIGSMKPVAETTAMQKASDLTLRLGVLALDAPHILASAIWRKMIHSLSKYRFSRSPIAGQLAL